jgi:rhodanese-related sulfurtransferase/peroxiredoxin
MAERTMQRAARRARRLLTWSPPAAGQPAPRLSLTADDGTWIRLTDLEGQVNALIVFQRSLADGQPTALLRELSARNAELHQLQTLVFGVATDRPGELRARRKALSLPFPLLYDPLGLDARGWQASSRLLPMVRDHVFFVDKQGQLRRHWRGHPGAAELLAALSEAEGRPVTAAAGPAVRRISSAEATELLTLDPKGWLLLDVRTLSEYEADHAPMAVHLPVDELPARYAELGRTDRIICVCQAGGRSAAAAEFLASVGGKEVCDVIGGMSAWSGPRVTGGAAQ